MTLAAVEEDLPRKPEAFFLLEVYPNAVTLLAQRSLSRNKLHAQLSIAQLSHVDRFPRANRTIPRRRWWFSTCQFRGHTFEVEVVRTVLAVFKPIG